MNKITFTNLIRHFIAFSAIVQPDRKHNLCYPHLSVFSADRRVQISFSVRQIKYFECIEDAIAYLKEVEPIELPLNGLESVFQNFLSPDPDVYLRFYPLGFYWEYCKLGIGGLESGETVEQLRETIDLHERISVSV